MIFGVRGILDVVGARTVARFTSLLLQLVPGIQPKHIGMKRVGKLIVLCRVTRDAHRFANVFGSAVQRLVYFRFGRRCGLCTEPRKEREGRDAQGYQTNSKCRC